MRVRGREVREKRRERDVREERERERGRADDIFTN